MSQETPLLDPERIAALATYEIMDTLPEFDFDALTDIASEICGTPVALISLMDEHRQWFKSNCGLPEITECPAEVTVCSTTICSNDILYVPDLTKDQRFKDLPIVTGPPDLRAYCGVPLINDDGFALGTLCVVDFKPFELSGSQREAVRRLARQAMSLLELRRQILVRDGLLKEVSEAKRAADEAREKSDSFLYSIFPKSVAHELKTKSHVEPKYYEMATILFADFMDFALLTEGLEPARLIEQLNKNFSRFDQIAAQNRVVTLRTVGDGYLCAAGLPEKNNTHCVDACLTALQLQKFLSESNQQREMLHLKPWRQRIGINTGPMVAGVVGTKRFTYDVWGTAVNTAARLEQACEPDRINISTSTLHHLGGLFETVSRGQIEVKNLGAIDMHFLDRIKPEYSADTDGCVPNEDFWSAFGKENGATI
ncbi:MAG: GAF domain-containing protein [Rhodospirillales bacterium]|nr:GAF domain-containing protein [Rhodospirillales bacterium]